MTQLKVERERKGLGTTVGAWADEVDRLPYVSFAHDTILLPSSRQALTFMLRLLDQSMFAPRVQLRG